jgi:two-component system, OmpR family, response regulator
MADPIPILVVDDEPEVRRILRQGFEAEGFSVVEAADKISCLQSLKKYPVKLITLDLKLQNENGLELALEIRTRRNVPIIMITGLDTPLDRLTGLEYGADDYITKPFHIREVIIRVRRVLATYGLAGDKAPGGGETRSLYFEGLVFDARKRQVRTTGGASVELTETELQLLETFLRYPGRVLSRDELTRALRGHDWSPLDRMVDGHVSRLRRKVDADSEDEPRFIKSVRGVGYVFTGEVRLGD